MTRFCIITNTDTHVKMAIVDWRCTPLIAIDDPKLMIAKPAALTAATGMDTSPMQLKPMCLHDHAYYRCLCRKSH